MPRHKIPEAARLVGKDRKTLYAHMKKGRLTYGLDDNGARYLETSELLRVYGKLRTPETVEQERIEDVERLKTTTTTDKLLRHLIGEVRLLREENRQQVEQLEAIRHEIADRPLLVASETPAEQKPSYHDEKTADTPRHSFASIMDKLKARSD